MLAIPERNREPGRVGQNQKKPERESDRARQSQREPGRVRERRKWEERKLVQATGVAVSKY